jgi:hypothetical protein
MLLLTEKKQEKYFEITKILFLKEYDYQQNEDFKSI